MAKMHGHYFGRGRKIMTRYFRRNASGLLLYFAYSIARIVGDVLLILLPVFATSSFNSAHMLKETGDLYLSKSFDHAEDEKSYRSLLLFAAVVVLGAGALIAGLIFLNEYIRFILFLAILNPDSASIFYWMTFAVFTIIEFVIGFCAFGLIQVASYISRKNPSLGVGDIAYDAMQYMKNHGGKLFIVDFEVTIYYALWIVFYPVAWFVFPNLSSGLEGIFPLLFTILRYVELLFMIFHLVVLLPHFMMLITVSPYLLFEETADASRHVVIYPKKKDEVTEPDTRGRYISAIPLNELVDDENHPLEVNSDDRR